MYKAREYTNCQCDPFLDVAVEASDLTILSNQRRKLQRLEDFTSALPIVGAKAVLL